VESPDHQEENKSSTEDSAKEPPPVINQDKFVYLPPLSIVDDEDDL